MRRPAACEAGAPGRGASWLRKFTAAAAAALTDQNNRDQCAARRPTRSSFAAARPGRSSRTGAETAGGGDARMVVRWSKLTFLFIFAGAPSDVHQISQENKHVRCQAWCVLSSFLPLRFPSEISLIYPRSILVTLVSFRDFFDRRQWFRAPDICLSKFCLVEADIFVLFLPDVSFAACVLEETFMPGLPMHDSVCVLLMQALQGTWCPAASLTSGSAPAPLMVARLLLMPGRACLMPGRAHFMLGRARLMPDRPCACSEGGAGYLWSSLPNFIYCPQCQFIWQHRKQCSTILKNIVL